VLIDRGNLGRGRQIVVLRFAENHEESIGSTDAGLLRIVEPRVGVAALLEFCDAQLCALAQLIERAELNRLRGAGGGARGDQANLLAVVTERAFESAAVVGAFVDHPERARDDAVAAAVANVVLHVDATELGTNNGPGGASFQTA